MVPSAVRAELKVGIVGGGAVGTLLAYALNVSGVAPYIIYRDNDKKRKRLEKGLKILVKDAVGGPSKEYHIRARHVTYDELPKKFLDVVFIATKAYDFKDALLNALPLLSDGCIAVSCQNGLGSLEYLESTLSEEKAAALVLNAGVYEIDEVTYVLAGYGRSYIGQRCRRVSPRVEEVAKLLQVLNVRVVRDIEGYRWLKLIVNSAINPITAILRAKNSVIIEDPLAAKLASKVVLEGWLVSKEAGISLPRNPLIELVNVAYHTRDNYSSMCQDVIKGKRTEVDYINAAIVEVGRKVGVRAVLNQVLTYIIKSLEGNS
ncbi:MAG: 2-dehydropantoate 2-reductase [Desulfurococcales archaeon]|nr:2-dehydropantoate 2-reductase [Desulfurococcales archaeon]